MVDITEQFNKLDGVNVHYLKRYIKFIGSVSGCDVKHHILPKSLFPVYTDLGTHTFNCAELSHRQHYIAHWMLAKAVKGSHHMTTAFFMMSNCKDGGRVLNSNMYLSAMRLYSESRRYFKHSDESKRKISSSVTQHFIDHPEIAGIISEANIGRVLSDEHLDVIRRRMVDDNPMKTEAQKQRMRGDGNVSKRDEVRAKISKNCWATGLPPWESVRCTEDSLRVWSKACDAYDFYIEEIGVKPSKLAKHIGEPNKTPVYNLHLKLKGGWDPRKDVIWCKKFT